MSNASTASSSSPLRSFSRLSLRHKAGTLAAVAALCLVGGTLLTGCGGGDSSSAPAPGPGTGTGSGGVQATFSRAAGTNANTAAFQSTNVLAANSAGAFTILNITGTNISGSTSRTFVIALVNGGPIQAGKTYNFSSTGIDSASTLTYTESAVGTAHAWVATGGSAIVDSVTGKNDKLRIVNATMEAGADNTSGATGSFTVNGTADATLP